MPRAGIDFIAGFLTAKSAEHVKAAASAPNPEHRMAHFAVAFLQADAAALIRELGSEDVRLENEQKSKEAKLDAEDAAKAILASVAEADLPSVREVIKAVASGTPPGKEQLTKAAGLAQDVAERVLPIVMDVGSRYGALALKGALKGLKG
jgi:hypothetical protein